MNCLEADGGARTAKRRVSVLGGRQLFRLGKLSGLIAEVCGKFF
jgi:hypothetical protein